MQILPAASFLNASNVQNNDNNLNLKTVKTQTEMESWLSSYVCIQYSLQKEESDEAPLVDETLETDQGPMMALSCRRGPRWYFAFSVAKATLQSQMSVCLSVCHQNPSASQNCSYQPSSLSTIEPFDHQAYQPSSLSTIEPINHQAYQPSSLSTIEPIIHWAYQP